MSTKQYSAIYYLILRLLGLHHDGVKVQLPGQRHLQILSLALKSEVKSLLVKDRQLKQLNILLLQKHCRF